MNTKILLIAVLAISLASCKNKTQQNQSTNHEEVSSNINEINNKSFVLSCGSGCAMTYTAGNFTQNNNTIKVKFKIETHTDGALTDTYNETYIFTYNELKQIQKIELEGQNGNILESLMPDAQETFIGFGNELFHSINNDKLEIPADEREFPGQKYLIKNNGVDIFLIGQKIPTQADGYSITKSIETRIEEGEEFEILVYTVAANGQKMLNIEPFAYDVGNESADTIGNIFILSDKFKTAENIGLYSTIEEFTAAYPDFTIWYSYVSDRYVIEAGQPFHGIQFILDGNDYIHEGGPEFESDMTILKPADFKKDSKIKEIRIWGYE